MSENDELKAEAAAEAAAENVHVHEEEPRAAWTEDVQMAGSEVADFLKKVFKESTARRVIIKNQSGRVLMDIPVLVGALGLLPGVLVYTLVALGVVLLSQCTITIERVADDSDSEAVAHEEVEITIEEAA